MRRRRHNRKKRGWLVMTRQSGLESTCHVSEVCKINKKGTPFEKGSGIRAGIGILVEHLTRPGRTGYHSLSAPV